MDQPLMPAGIRLRFLGTRGEIELRSRRHQWHTALLVECGQARIMLDCGVDWLYRVARLRPSTIVLTHAHHGLMAREREFIALREAIEALPRDIKEKLWVVAQVGRGDVAVLGWDDALAETSALSDDDIVTTLVGEANLHEYLRKGLYELGATG